MNTIERSAGLPDSCVLCDGCGTRLITADRCIAWIYPIAESAVAGTHRSERPFTSATGACREPLSDD